MNSSVASRPEAQLPHAVAFGAIISVGFPLNAVALWVLLRHHGLKSPNVVFMVNLAVSDLLLAASLPLRVYFFATGTWPLTHVSCTLAEALFTVNVRCSSIFITFIGVDRLLAIVYPLRSRHVRTACNAAKAAAVAWLFVLVSAVPPTVMFAKHLNELNASVCFHCSNLDVTFREATGTFQCVLVLTLLIVNVVSTSLVSLTLWRNVKDVSKVNVRVNVMLLFAMSLVMFAVCFVPETVSFFITRKNSNLRCLGALNCCLDPVLYCFSMDTFWKKKEEKDRLKYVCCLPG
ncbi:lysophosphatidic acid receptor 6-like [Eucyclogobius newberryi]|uniref:lysophosphatidic acid receptor 6-like n=1 Tax=Eucyclogobius newberryi TaxID=166745 RepID=UPI003B59A286